MFALSQCMVAPSAQSAAEAFNVQATDGAWGSFCDAELDFEHPALAAVLELWRDKAGSRPIPARSDFSLRVLKAFLPDIAIYEHVASESGPRYRVRIMGATFAETMGDLTGKFLDDAVPEPFLQRWYAALDAAFAAGTPLRFTARSNTFNKSFLIAEYFQAPLLDDNGEARLILAASYFAGPR